MQYMKEEDPIFIPQKAQIAQKEGSCIFLTKSTNSTKRRAQHIFDKEYKKHK